MLVHQVDLSEWIDFTKSKCLNIKESDALSYVLTGASEGEPVTELASESDEQLLIKIAYAFLHL